MHQLLMKDLGVLSRYYVNGYLMREVEKVTEHFGVYRTVMYQLLLCESIHAHMAYLLIQLVSN